MRKELVKLLKRSLNRHIGKSCLLAENLAEDILKENWMLIPCDVGGYVWYFDEEKGRLVKGIVEGYLWFKTCGFALDVKWEEPIMGHFAYTRKEVPFGEIGETVFLSVEQFTKKYTDTSDLEKAVELLEQAKTLKGKDEK